MNVKIHLKQKNSISALDGSSWNAHACLKPIQHAVVDHDTRYPIISFTPAPHVCAHLFANLWSCLCRGFARREAGGCLCCTKVRLLDHTTTGIEFALSHGIRILRSLCHVLVYLVSPWAKINRFKRI